MKKFERVKAVVSLDAIAHNFEEMKKNIADGTSGDLRPRQQRKRFS